MAAELHLIAGPDGSGKSTFVRQVSDAVRMIDYAIPPVIDPDAIARRLNPTDPDAAAARAGRIALRERAEALARGDSFAIETTLSGQSELRLIRDARERGYVVTMSYFALGDPLDNVKRVQLRAQEEKRTVPEADVVRRYARSLGALAPIADELTRLYVYDNSGNDLMHRTR